MRQSDRDDDLSPHTPGFEMPHRFRDAVQWLGAVDARCHLAGLDEGGELVLVAGAFLAGQHGQPLRHERREEGSPQRSTEPSGPLAPFLPADDDERPGRREDAPQAGEGGVACDVDDQVVPVGAVGEVLTRVVDDVVSTEGFNQASFAVLHTPVTSTSNALASCTA